MWLRQIQRDPSEFLVTKFYLQLEQEKVREQASKQAENEEQEEALTK